MNLYEYCGNDPINRIDPTGLVPVNISYLDPELGVVTYTENFETETTVYIGGGWTAMGNNTGTSNQIGAYLTLFGPDNLLEAGTFQSPGSNFSGAFGGVGLEAGVVGGPFSGAFTNGALGLPGLPENAPSLDVLGNSNGQQVGIGLGLGAGYGVGTYQTYTTTYPYLTVPYPNGSGCSYNSGNNGP